MPGATPALLPTELPLGLMHDALQAATAGHPERSFDSLLAQLGPWGIGRGALYVVGADAELTQIAGGEVGPDAAVLDLEDGYARVGQFRVEVSAETPRELLELLRSVFALGLGQRTRIWELELVRAAVGVNAAESFDDSLQVLVETCCRLVDVPSANIAIWDPEFTTGTVRAASGLAEPLAGAQVGRGSISHQATQRRAPILLTTVDEQEGITEEIRALAGSMACTLSVPLMIDGAPRITFQLDWVEEPDAETVTRAITAIEKLEAVTGVAFRSEQEREREAHGELLRGVIETVPEGILIQHRDQLTLNAEARRLVRLSPEEPVDKLVDLRPRWLDGTVVAPEEYPSRRCRALGRKVSARMRVTVVGEERIFDFTAAPLPEGFVGVISDVTEEYSEQVLAERFLEALFESLPLGVGVADIETGELKRVNGALAELVGMDPLEMVGLQAPFPWWEPGFNADYWDSPGAPFETVFRRKDGRPVPVELLPFHVHDAEGAPAWLVVLARETSERHEFERQLVQSGKLAAIGELASGVAHEINNPLFAILGLVEFLLRDAEPGTKAHERLSLVQQTGLEIKEIVKALLDFARERTDELRPMALRDVVAEGVALIRRTSAAKSVELVEHYSDEPVPILGSPNQIKQIVLNLVSNAQHALGDEGGTVTISVERQDDCVTLAVSDTGPGIPEDVLPRIFEPFFTTKRDVGGTGLGLAVSHGIAEMHGGSLTASSEPGVGATFCLRLPVVDQAAA